MLCKTSFLQLHVPTMQMYTELCSCAVKFACIPHLNLVIQLKAKKYRYFTSDSMKQENGMHAVNIRH